ncbi:MAG: sigma-70 family RNA polymerase sigma factor, partial [Alphaproteobacteria bacterium]|nr:sigma-70 family RNA polymerase sigma factor [Alphaproteobacteria bacterium]
MADPERMTADPDPGSTAPNPASLALLSDEVLMSRIGNGDEAAYAVLMDRHVDRSLGMATRLLNNRAEAEDTLQEAFLRLWKAAPNWSAEGARFSTWFYRVVMNLCIDAKRRRKAPHLALEDAPEIADSAP